MKNEQMPRTPSALVKKRAKHCSLLFWIQLGRDCIFL